MKRCHKEAVNPETKNAYEKGLEILSKDTVYCMKISDKNTKGVETGRDKAWGAFVFDEGKSVKYRPGSAGSHGVGKKVPFIISSINTVLYSTRNKYLKDGKAVEDVLFQGKCQLINWHDENNKKRHYKGWYGNVDLTRDSDEVVKPLEGKELESVNDYFVRKDDCGTDVTIVGVNAYDREDAIKVRIISAILENFYVAILRSQLILTVMGQKIAADNFQEVYERYYQVTDDGRMSLKNCLDAYESDAAHFEIMDKNKNKIGSIDIHLTLESDNKNKYYAIIRDHGMKIQETRINMADQYFTGVVIVNKEGILNDLLLKLENAAHDKFILEDEYVKIDPEALYAYKQMEKTIKDYIVEQTKIAVGEEQELEGLDNILEIPGQKSVITHRNEKTVLKRKSISVPGTGKPSRNKDEGEGAAVVSGDRPEKPHKPGTGGMTPGGTVRGKIFLDYKKSPVFSYSNKEYTFRFEMASTLKKARIQLNSINADGKADDTLFDYVKKVTVDGKVCKRKGRMLETIKLAANKQHIVKLLLSDDCRYQIAMQIRDEEGEVKDNE